MSSSTDRWLARPILAVALFVATRSEAFEPRDIDLSTIITSSSAGTRKIGDIVPIGLLKEPLYNRREESRTWAATKCFLVAGHDGASVANTRNAFRNDVGALAVAKEGDACSLVFFAKASPFYLSIERVAVLDGVIEIDYLATGRYSSEANSYLAIIPLPPLSARDWHIKPRPLPLSRVSADLARNEQYAEGYAKLLKKTAEELIAGEGKFRVVESVQQAVVPDD